MDDNRRDELDVLVEGALREWAFGEAPSERVWREISRRVQGLSRRTPSTSHRVRQFCTEAWYWSADLLVAARIVLAPSLHGAENGWTERLVLAGQSHGLCHLSIHY